MRNVIWCTGYSNGLSWIDLPIFDATGEPRHVMGVVDAEPGLCFVGQLFQYSVSSTMIHGMGKDAARVAGTVRERRATGIEPTRIVKPSGFRVRHGVERH